MALNKDPIFGSAPKFAAVVATLQNTNTDGTTGTYYEIFTAGADGAIVTSLIAYARATVTATACRLFISTDGGTTKSYMADLLMPAHTLANTTANAGVVTFVNKLNPDSAIRLPANAKIYGTIAVALAGGIVFSAEYSDLSA